MLANAKKEAVENEDFQRAAYIKSITENFKQMEVEIIRL